MVNELLVAQVDHRRAVRTAIVAVELTLALFLCLRASSQEVAADDVPRPEFNGLSYKQVTRRIFEGEQDTIKRLGISQLVTESYIQSLVHVQRDGLDTDLDERSEHVVDDAYFLGSVNLENLYDGGSLEKLLFGKVWRDQYIRISNDLYEKVVPLGQFLMFFVDLADFDADTYTLKYGGRERLLDTDCMLFSVTPTQFRGSARFSGMVWVEASSLKIARIKGVFLGPPGKWYKHPLWLDRYFHFDSWRVRVRDGVWFPTSTYFEERRTFAADGNLQFHYRGYSLLWQHWRRHRSVSGNTNAGESGDGATRSSDDSTFNPLMRLDEDGLLAISGEVERKLDAIVQRIVPAAGLPQTIHCRVLLTTPVEVFTIGNWIILSRGLLNIVPDDRVLAVLLAGQIAHIILGHSYHIPRQLTNSLYDSTKQRDFPGLGIKYSPEQVQEADQEMITLLKGSPYENALSTSKEFLAQLQAHGGRFPNLLRPRFGMAVVPQGDQKHPRSVGISETSSNLRFRDRFGVSWDGRVFDRGVDHEADSTDRREKQGLAQTANVK
jgi:hypothetical protein